MESTTEVYRKTKPDSTKNFPTQTHKHVWFLVTNGKRLRCKDRIILGFKYKALAHGKHLSYRALAKESGLPVSFISRSVARLRAMKLLDDEGTPIPPPCGFFQNREPHPDEQKVWWNYIRYIPVFIPLNLKRFPWTFAAMYCFLAGNKAQKYHQRYLALAMGMRVESAMDVVHALATHEAGLCQTTQTEDHAFLIITSPVTDHLDLFQTNEETAQVYQDHQPDSPETFVIRNCTKAGMPHKLANDLAELAVRKGVVWKDFLDMLKEADIENKKKKGLSHCGFLLRWKLNQLADGGALKPVHTNRITEYLDDEEEPLELPPAGPDDEDEPEPEPWTDEDDEPLGVPAPVIKAAAPGSEHYTPPDYIPLGYILKPKLATAFGISPMALETEMTAAKKRWDEMRLERSGADAEIQFLVLTEHEAGKLVGRSLANSLDNAARLVCRPK